MAQVKLTKIGAEGFPVEMDTAADDITLASYTVTGGGPVLSGTGLDMNNTSVSEILNLDFNDPSTATIDQTAGALIVDDLMFQTKENSLAVGSAVLFPVITDVADSVDAFRLPALAGVPSASPSDGGEGYLVWDSTGDRLFAWNGSSWDDLSTVTDAQNLVNPYTAAEILVARDAVYISAADNVSKAQANALASARLIGFAVAGAGAASSVDIKSAGTLGGFTGLTAGAPQYLSAATAGALTETLPTGAGNVVVRAGYAKNTTTLDIHIEQLGRRAS